MQAAILQGPPFTSASEHLWHEIRIPADCNFFSHLFLGCQLGDKSHDDAEIRSRFALLSQITKLHLSIDFARLEGEDESIDAKCAHHYKLQIHIAIRTLEEKCSSLPPQLTVALTGRDQYAGDNELGQQEALCDSVMYHLTECTQLRFEGIPASAENFIRAWKQHKPPLPNIYSLGDALYTSVNDGVPEGAGRRWYQRCEEAILALSRFNIQRFLHLRRSIIQDVEADSAAEALRLEALRVENKVLILQPDLTQWIIEADAPGDT